VRMDLNRPIEAVSRAMLDANMDAHWHVLSVRSMTDRLLR
jgi:hypothetical protein